MEFSKSSRQKWLIYLFFKKTMCRNLVKIINHFTYEGILIYYLNSFYLNLYLVGDFLVKLVLEMLMIKIV